MAKIDQHQTQDPDSSPRHDAVDSTHRDRRMEDRLPMLGDVTVKFSGKPVVGSGQNISHEGVYFVAEGAVKVQVVLQGRDEPIAGHVVRVAIMGDGKTGIAVVFDQPVEDEPLEDEPA